MKGPNSHPLAPTTPTARVSFKISGAAFGVAEQGGSPDCSALVGGWVDGGHVTGKSGDINSSFGDVNGSFGDVCVGVSGGDAAGKRAACKFQKAVSNMEGMLAKRGDPPPTSGSGEGEWLGHVVWAGPNKLVRIARPGEVLRLRRMGKGSNVVDVDEDVGKLPVAITMAEKLELGDA